MIVDAPTHTCVADIETKTDAEANARLIAAAPELLTKLKALVNELASAFEAGSARAFVLDEAKKAIAKAEGRS